MNHDIRDHLSTDSTAMDLGDTIVHVCPCGNNVFKVFATFGDYEMETYSTDGECIECGTRFKVPTPVDHPEYRE